MVVTKQQEFVLQSGILRHSDTKSAEPHTHRHKHREISERDTHRGRQSDTQDDTETNIQTDRILTDTQTYR